MEINAEINKVFGQEMAKMFAETISEDEIKQAAEKAWKDLNAHENTWGRATNSQLEEYIRKEFLKQLQNRVEEILKEPQDQELLESRARELVAKAREISEESIVRFMAEKMTDNVLSAWNYHDRVVMEVLNELKVQAEK